ncbi:MAG: RNA polymerase sigma factor RpoH [Polyangiales bacterium]
MAAGEKDVTVSRYIAMARAVEPLSREEETALARAWRDRQDPKAAEQLIRASLRFVVAIAISYRRYGLRLGDLISEGNLGLMMALRKFDPDRGVKFATYAAYWSRAYILNHVIRSWSMVGAGSGPLRSKLFFKLRRERAMIANQVGEGDERTSMTMLAERMGQSVEKTEEQTQRLDARDVSLDAQVHEDGKATMLEGLTDAGPSQEDRFFDAERGGMLQQALSDAIATLDERERYIVEARLMADEETSLAEIGRKLGVSRERARQLETRAKDKLRKQLGALAQLLDLPGWSHAA